MNYISLGLGLIALGIQAVIGFMFAVFSVSGDPTNQTSATLSTIGMYGIPLAAALGAILMLIAYSKGWPHTYAWILLPLPCIVLWFSAFMVFGPK